MLCNVTVWVPGEKILLNPLKVAMFLKIRRTEGKGLFNVFFGKFCLYGLI